jgi:hypothetical protein
MKSIHLLLILSVVLRSYSFVPVQVVRQNVLQISAETEEEDAELSPTKPAVKCPDCDLCDGSGRYGEANDCVLTQ